MWCDCLAFECGTLAECTQSHAWWGSILPEWRKKKKSDFQSWCHAFIKPLISSDEERIAPFMWHYTHCVCIKATCCVCECECCSMAYRLGAAFPFARRGGPAVTHCGSVVGDWRGDALAAAAAAAALHGWQGCSRERGVHPLSAGTELVSRAQIQPVRPLAWPLEGCSHTPSTCQSGFTPVEAGGKLAEEILTACRPGIPC